MTGTDRDWLRYETGADTRERRTVGLGASLPAEVSLAAKKTPLRGMPRRYLMLPLTPQGILDSDTSKPAPPDDDAHETHRCKPDRRWKRDQRGLILCG